MRIFLASVLLLIVVSPQAGGQGTKVVLRHTSGDHTSEETTYRMGDRRRTEYRNNAQRRNAAGLLVRADPPANVIIQRCDLGQSFELNTHMQEYTSKEYPPKPPTPEERKERGLDEPDWDTSLLPVVRVEITTTDTGERDEIFGHVARHVITTFKETPFKETPLNDSRNESPVFVTDGWYIDFDRRISCEPKPSQQPRYTFSWVGAGGRLVPSERTESVEVGRREMGLLVRKAQNSLSTTNPVNIGNDYIQTTNEPDVTEFYEGPLDPALFEIPPGFKVVENLRWSSTE
jgi:hypothetical protein